MRETGELRDTQIRKGAVTIQLVSLQGCPACQSRNGRRLLFELGTFNVFRCACGMEFIDPSLDGRGQMEIYRTSRTLKGINDALGHYYEYDTLKPGTRTHSDYEKACREAARFATGPDLLEVGCGTGSFLKFARKKGWRVLGVDSSPENIESLEKSGMEGICSDFMSYHTEQRFDAIVFWDVLEHPQGPREFVMKARDLLKDKGIILAAVPLYPNFLSMIAAFLYRLTGGRMKAPLKKLYVVEHTSYFSERVLRDLMNRAGFEVLKTWKTETDLDRYAFGRPLVYFLKTAFGLARVLGLQNRLMMIARKKS